MMLDVVIYTCEGREHLVRATWKSFWPQLERLQPRIILAIDGRIEPDVCQLIGPDIVVQSHIRRGYIHSLLGALRLVDTKYHFWLEDDWEVTRVIDFGKILMALEANPNWMQVRLSKQASLSPEDGHLSGHFHGSSVGFSANPSICRTDAVRAGFEYLRSLPKGDKLGVDGFENVLTRWAAENKWVCAVDDPGGRPTIVHLGDLDSTGRAWHMTKTLTQRPDGFGYIGDTPPVWRRLLMLLKLTRAFAKVAVCQLFDDACYDLAFRIVHAPKKLVGRQDEI